VTNLSLAQSYLLKARARLKILPVLLDASDYSDVVREAQEIVELALKGMLRHAGVEPPHWHDVGGLVKQYVARFPGVEPAAFDRLATASTWLRKEREFAFYGDIDLVPTDQYDATHARRAMDDAQFVVRIAESVIVL
jgi:HEPN domain-containing protein